MCTTLPVHTSSDEDGDKLVYHHQSECGYLKEMFRNGHQVAGVLLGSFRCERRAEIAAGS